MQPLQPSTTNSSWEQELLRLLGHSGATRLFKPALFSAWIMRKCACACMMVSLVLRFRVENEGLGIMEFVDKVSLKREAAFIIHWNFQALALEFTSMLCFLLCNYYASKRSPGYVFFFLAYDYNPFFSSFFIITFSHYSDTVSPIVAPSVFKLCRPEILQLSFDHSSSEPWFNQIPCS